MQGRDPKIDQIKADKAALTAEMQKIKEKMAWTTMQSDTSDLQRQIKLIQRDITRLNQQLASLAPDASVVPQLDMTTSTLPQFLSDIGDLSNPSSAMSMRQPKSDSKQLGDKVVRLNEFKKSSKDADDSSFPLDDFGMDAMADIMSCLGVSNKVATTAVASIPKGKLNMQELIDLSFVTDELDSVNLDKVQQLHVDMPAEASEMLAVLEKCFAIMNIQYQLQQKKLASEKPTLSPGPSPLSDDVFNRRHRLIQDERQHFLGKLVAQAKDKLASIKKDLLFQEKLKLSYEKVARTSSFGAYVVSMTMQVEQDIRDLEAQQTGFDEFIKNIDQTIQSLVAPVTASRPVLLSTTSSGKFKMFGSSMPDSSMPVVQGVPGLNQAHASVLRTVVTAPIQGPLMDDDSEQVTHGSNVKRQK